MSHRTSSSLERAPHHRHRSSPPRGGRGADRITDLADTLSRSTLTSVLRSLDDMSDMVEGVLAAVGERQRTRHEIGDRGLPMSRHGGRKHGEHGQHGTHDHDHSGHHEHHGRDHHESCCDECWDPHEVACCEPDPCGCVCCVVDADLEIRTRVGERRVVPIRIDNTRVRERQINLELGSWSRRGGGEGDVSVESSLDRRELTVEGCSHEQVILTVATSTARDNERRDVDVDDCTVYYTDLRIEGCDTRPVRIALVILPRDCDAFEIGCSCSCC